MAQKQIIGHRGAPALARENTLESFQKALDLGVDVIELDVRKTKDEALAVFHNHKIGGKKIERLTFAELNNLSLLQNFKALTLEEALGYIAGKSEVQIDIKDLGLELQVAEKALEFFKPEKFSILSYQINSLITIKNKYPRIKVGLVIGFRHPLKALQFLIKRRKFLKQLDFLAVNWGLWLIGFRKFIPKDLSVTIWAPDDSFAIKKLLNDPQVLGIASNLPDKALQLRRKFYAKSQ